MRFRGRPLAAAAGERPQTEGVAFRGSCCVVYESLGFAMFYLLRDVWMGRWSGSDQQSDCFTAGSRLFFQPVDGTCSFMGAAVMPSLTGVLVFQ